MAVFHETHVGALLRVMYESERLTTGRHHLVPGLEEHPLTIHRTPFGSLLISHRGRPFAIKSAIWANTQEAKNKWRGHYKRGILPRWYKALESHADYQMTFYEYPEAVLSPWEYESKKAVEKFREQGGLIHAMKYADVVVSVLDSYCSGNCMLGTRQLINQAFDGNPVITVGELVWCLVNPENKFWKWRMDIERIIAWSVFTQQYQDTLKQKIDFRQYVGREKELFV